MSAGRRPLPTEARAPRAAVIVLAHRRDAAGVPWARAPIADGDALETVLGVAVTAGLSPVVVVLAEGDLHPALADEVVTVEATADEATAIAAARVALDRRAGPPPLYVLTIPVEQPLASGTLLWALVASAEARPEVSIAAGHDGRAGHPRALRLDSIGRPNGPGTAHVVEAGELALFWTATAGGALDEATRARARGLLGATSLRVRRLGAGGALSEPDVLATEEPLEIRLRGEALAVLMRTPGHDTELATGFLLTEAVVRSAAEIRGVSVRGNHVLVDVEPEVAARVTARRSFYASSSCGVCGKSSIDEVVLHFPRVSSSLVVTRELLSALPARLAAAQTVFSRTGGLHAAGLFDASGALRVIREDVGRHNAVDKVVGWAARAGALPLSDSVLMVSGRIGFEIAQKATAAGVALVAAVGAPSSLAVSLAVHSGVTLVGFLRDGRGNVYTHPDRVV
jgi:FdhD protein